MFFKSRKRRQQELEDNLASADRMIRANLTEKHTIKLGRADTAANTSNVNFRFVRVPERISQEDWKGLVMLTCMPAGTHVSVVQPKNRELGNRWKVQYKQSTEYYAPTLRAAIEKLIDGNDRVATMYQGSSYRASKSEEDS